MGISGLGLALLTLASHQVLTSLGAPAAAEATTPGKQSGEQGQVVSGVGGSAAGINGGSSSSWDKVWSPNFQDYWGVFQPAFENNSMSNVSVHAGEVAFLPCPVRFLGDRSTLPSIIT
ncbi:unnamed protein product [Notodromas monacha]|uniref:Uncharacterized protein n=1 Tax=Notodromas monacha TaxID=399045 RepID=A0A7R9BKV0_9CRUS|nr:unnamed protein product [Notodromas monacha]CAG0917083.1 unnamed protein product [Notodromas monacha]